MQDSIPLYHGDRHQIIVTHREHSWQVPLQLVGVGQWRTVDDHLRFLLVDVDNLLVLTAREPQLGEDVGIAGPGRLLGLATGDGGLVPGQGGLVERLVAALVALVGILALVNCGVVQPQ